MKPIWLQIGGKRPLGTDIYVVCGLQAVDELESDVVVNPVDAIVVVCLQFGET